jgi:8-oxo-dGTP pyrophosphatase MutT (NUDIX family)
MEDIKYEGRLVEVLERKVESNGKQFVAEITRRPPGTRLIITKGDQILLTREHRHELNGHDFRLPGGKVFDTIKEYRSAVESGEDMMKVCEKAAAREALEEAGIRANALKFLHTSICGAAVTWDLLYFLIDDFTEEDQQLEEAEDIKIVWVSRQEAREMCLNGKISEDRSVAILLRFLEGVF